ncbi:carbohydrate ABC transporter membrane protein 1 (CUT1 family) [Haloactinopolyspora alba]|uniref:Carbohydrate ABC transporter membrane protein 1 (CUT1 family) n=1 Tax=Haloactinopolyspora alba TaxID=648780 RepID=A0A2P8DM46_9ACTN|nr:sugar ABC transporter permease [Haloactinopolyspora alba]PSK98274.1 carbohydrate ABC transporter membrane protein 1 (CUT1 family) [Haloactinopolyspora alba]
MTAPPAATPPATPESAVTGTRRPRGRPGRWSALGRALPWLTPALLLIAGVVLFPAGYMAWTSVRDLSQFGMDNGPAGLDNYARLLEFGALPRVLLNTVVWVFGVVVTTVLISLGLAQFLDKAFPGRRIVRLAVIIPWAASVVMTTTVFYYGMDPFYGVINTFLVDVGLLDQPYGFTRNALPAFLTAMGIAVFVSLPFTTYTLLAGLQTITLDVREAAQMDGAGPWAAYRQIILPLLRPALAVATIINIINVFNSLPILQVMTGSIPGYSADTTTTLIFKFIRADRQIDTASALSVLNFVIVLGVILVYLKVVKPMRED